MSYIHHDHKLIIQAFSNRRVSATAAGSCYSGLLAFQNTYSTFSNVQYFASDWGAGSTVIWSEIGHKYSQKNISDENK